tara:strand:+ start:49 stop:651 length:603 start_codon:yes stop_codon:yes gene_type:complete
MIRKWRDSIRLKINNYIIIDDFFPDEICTELREKSLNAKEYTKKYWDYKALDFDNGDLESLQDISNKYVVPKIPLAEKYLRSWSFVYDNIARGVGIHADPSFINVNIWVTPDKCVENYNKNGLIIYHKHAPKEWSHDEYNWDKSYLKIKSYLKDSKYDRIPYKYNRAIIFKGSAFHSTDNVHMKPGEKNRRVNYTFLYDY